MKLSSNSPAIIRLQKRHTMVSAAPGICFWTSRDALNKFLWFAE